MSDYTRAIVAEHVIVCVACGQEVTSRVYRSAEENSFAVDHQHEDERVAEGWALFISRSRRWYCPEHRPKPGHAMRQEKPKVKEGADS